MDSDNHAVGIAVSLWNKHRDGLTLALEHGADHRQLADVYRAILEERAQVWGNEEAMIVTELYPDVGAVHAWLATGKLDAVLDLWRQVESWAKALGYHKATLCGRPGWTRVLRPEGWALQSAVLAKEL